MMTREQINMVAKSDIDPASWQANLSELHRLNGFNGLLIGPSKIGKTQMVKIAYDLLLARQRKTL